MYTELPQELANQLLHNAISKGDHIQDPHSTMAGFHRAGTANVKRLQSEREMNTALNTLSNTRWQQRDRAALANLCETTLILQKKSLFLKHRETCVDVHVTVFITVTLQTVLPLILKLVWTSTHLLPTHINNESYVQGEWRTPPLICSAYAKLQCREEKSIYKA